MIPFGNPDEIREVAKKLAEQDLKEGKLRIRTFGLIRSPRFLKQAYAEKGIELEIIAGDNITSCDEAHAAGYNEVMNPEIKKRFGENVFDEIRSQYNWLTYCARLDYYKAKHESENLHKDS